MSGRESGVIQRLRRSWIRAGSPGDVRVAFSGGADSLALLGLLRQLSRTQSFSLQAIHVDHGVRAESAADVDVVRANALALDVPLMVERIPDGALQLHGGVGLEEAMRRERYLLLARHARKAGSVIATGHHQRDQAETLLLHLLRGAGLAGVAGMREVSTLQVPWWGDAAAHAMTIWRPLLGEPDRVVRQEAIEIGLPVVEDASNSDLGFRRNAVRHRVIPELQAAFPGAVATLARFADLAALDADELEWQASEALSSVQRGADLDRRLTVALRPAIRNRVVRRWLLAGLPSGVEVSRDRVDAVLAVAEVSGPVRRVEVAAGWAVFVSRDRLRMWQANDA